MTMDNNEQHKRDYNEKDFDVSSLSSSMNKEDRGFLSDIDPLSDDFNRSILNSLDANIAVLDEYGTIIAVNDAWMQFAMRNSLKNLDKLGIGSNYLNTCQEAMNKQDADAEAALIGIQKVLKGEIEEWEYEYPCHSPFEERIFLMRVNPLIKPLKGVVISHINITRQKLTEIKSIELNRFVDSLISALGEIIYEYNPYEDYILWKGNYKAIFGEKKGQFSNLKRYTEKIHPEDRAYFYKTIDEAYNSNNIIQMEYRIRTTKGNYIWVQDRSFHHKDKHGNMERIIGVLQNIHQRKETEIALKQAEKRFTDIANNSAVCIFEVNPEGRFTYISPVVKMVLGYEPEPLIGHSIHDFFQIEDKAKNKTDFHSIFKTKQPFNRQIVQAFNKDKQKVVLEISGVPIFDHYQQFQGYRCSSINITDFALWEQRIKQSELRFKLMFNNAFDSMVMIDDQGSLLDINKKAAKTFGYTRNQIKNLSIFDLHPKKTWNQLKQSLNQLTKERVQYIPEISFVDKDSTSAIMEVGMVSFSIDKQNYIVITYRDITERRKAEERRRLATTVFENSIEAILITDENNQIIDTNDAFTRLTGYTRDEVLGQNPSLMKSGKHNQAFYENMWKDIQEKGAWEGEIWDRRKNGEIYPKWITISAVKNEKEEITHYVGIFSDITAIKQNEEYLQKIAHYDALTGLPNRILFRERLLQAIHNSNRRSTKVVLMFLDLDGFKEINDTMGHKAGDQLLTQMAERLKLYLTRENDTVARIGGDEFTIILGDIKQNDDAAVVANRILKGFIKPFTIDNIKASLTASIGITIYPNDGENIEDLIKNADQAMYYAKEKGKNNYQFFSHKLNEMIKKRLKMESIIKKAQEDKRLILQYQPRIDMKTMKIQSLEALLRLEDPDMGIIFPKKFLRFAEDSGIILSINESVMEMAVEQFKQWQNQGLRDIRLSVNIPVKQFLLPNFYDFLNNLLLHKDLEPKYFEIELSENILLEELETTLKTIEKLKRLGIYISLDGFGTGFSSISKLKDFNVDYLKIDISFIEQLTSNPNDKAIAKSIIALADSLDLKAVAVGVETQIQFDFLRKNNCEQMQGFYFSPPLNQEDVLPFIKNNQQGSL